MSGRIRFRTRFCSVDFRRFEPAVLAGPPLLFISMLSINLVLRSRPKVSDLFGAHDPEFIVPDGAGNKLLGR